ncbi:transcriptional regulator, LysR family protein [Rubellimicrobium mesophilum DSM 19309]|uniref:Transcriptional regulator, LysR family protein n=1 Tax=Rubellimicrobium mesophilum DSM 19309 TaxID=442562 RepID=A0A017HQS7_9RHOB|nr:LysR substrate-binding domain-containing protein [Rubellimicrobium mesophilum]EYD76670.1 transcriptional regulator, LysR family protein [Rubellimicrobium mesophilum DSM 19309]
MELDQIPPLNTLIAFQTVARCGSFSDAAAVLGLTQSGVSRRIKRLEDEVGAELFERLASGVTLTRTGEDYAQEVGRALDVLANLGERSLGRRVQGRLTVACSRAVGELWLVPRLGGLSAEFPDLELKLLVDDNFTHMRSDEYDLAIAFLLNPPPEQVLGQLGREEMVPVMAPSLPPLAEQARPVIFAIEETFKEWTDWGNWLSEAGLHLPEAARRWKLNDYDMAVRSARAGLGVAMGWTWLVRDDLDSGRLVPAHPHVLTGRGGYFLLRPPERHMRQLARRVADWMLASNRP